MAAMAAILEIYYALLLLNQKTILSGNQVSDTGPSWPSCSYLIIILTKRIGLILPGTPVILTEL